MIDTIGWTGVIIYLVAYGLLGFGFLSAEKVNYHVLNALGGLCLVIFSYHLADQPNLVVNLVWIALAIVSMVRIVAVKKRKEGRPASPKTRSALFLTIRMCLSRSFFDSTIPR